MIIRKILIMNDIKFLKLISRHKYEEVNGIYLVKPSWQYSDIFLFSKIIIKTEEFLIFTPNKEVGDIKLELKSQYIFPTNKKIIEYDKYNGQKFFDVKKSINRMGCYDQFTIEFGNLNTFFTIINNIGLLGVFESNPLIFEL